MFCKKCGISKESKNSLIQHELKCNLSKIDIINIIDDYTINFLSTKELSQKYNVSSSFVWRLLGDKIRSISESNILSNIKSPRKLSEECKRKISNSIKKFLKENPEKRMWVKNESKPSILFKKILLDNDIPFIEEYKPLEDRFFSIDIAFPDKKIGIEINGQQHYDKNGNLKEYYQNRHDLIESNGWILFEIKANLFYKIDFINKFLSVLKNKVDLHIDYTEFIQPKKKYLCITCNANVFRGSKHCIKCYQEDILSDIEITKRLESLKQIDLTKFGWVKKASEIIGISHTQTKRFIKRYYKGEYFERNSPSPGGTTK